MARGLSHKEIFASLSVLRTASGERKRRAYFQLPREAFIAHSAMKYEYTCIATGITFRNTVDIGYMVRGGTNKKLTISKSYNESFLSVVVSVTLNDLDESAHL